MTNLPPIHCTWTGEAWEPLKRHHNICNAELVVGQVYPLILHEDRSDASHKHEFAWLREAWLNLPEHLADQFPSPEHLRKRALIDSGFCNQEIIDAGSNASAIRVASLVRSMDDFALVIVRGPAVVIRRAKSQSRRAMDRTEFQASKTAVMETVAAMLSVTPDDLKRNAGRAA